MNPILIVGSINMDVLCRVDRLPLPGETISGKQTSYAPGGKGANQAVAAALAGGKAVMCGAVGDDAFADELLQSLRSGGVDTAHVVRKGGASGLALITVEETTGENTIVVSAGANGLLTVRDIPVKLIHSAACVLLQNEIPWEIGAAVIREAHAAGVPVYLNPAPAFVPDDESLAMVDTLIVNETEAGVVSGVETSTVEGVESAAERLLRKGPRCVIVTIGADGVYCRTADGGSLRLPAFRVQAVDTVAAGDTFIGFFAAACASGRSLKESIRFASAAAAVAVTRTGAQCSIPTAKETEAFLAGCGE